MKINNFILAILAITVVSIPLFGHFWITGDLSAHYYRLIAVQTQIDTSQFPMLFDFKTKNMQGYGYSWSLFYPPLTTILYALVNIITFGSFDSVTQLKIHVAIITLINFLVMYFSVFKMYKSKPIALCAAVLSITSYYFLYNQFLRSAFPEALAMSFIPLMALGLMGYVNRNNDKIFLPISFSLIVLSNIPATIAVCVFLIIFILAFYKDFLAQFKSVIFHTIIVFGLTCFFIIPLLYLSGSDIYAFTSMKSSYAGMWKATIPLDNILFSLRTASAPYRLVTPGIIVTVLTICLFICRKNNLSIFSALNRAEKVFVGISITLIWMCTPLFPWIYLPKGFPVLNFMQFPWRVMLISTSLLCIIGASTIVKITSNNAQMHSFLMASIILSLFAIYNPYEETKREPWYQVYFDYMPNNMVKNIDKLKKEPIKPVIVRGKGDVWMEKMRNGLPLYLYKCDSKCEIQLPVIPYKGYEVSGVDNFVENEMGLMQVSVSEPSGKIKLTYRPLAVVIPYVITILTIIALVLFIRKRK